MNYTKNLNYLLPNTTIGNVDIVLIKDFTDDSINIIITHEYNDHIIVLKNTDIINYDYSVDNSNDFLSSSYYQNTLRHKLGEEINIAKNIYFASSNNLYLLDKLKDIECENCGDTIHGFYHVLDDKNICMDCIDEYEKCNDCGEYFLTDDMIEVDNNYICQSCIDNYFSCERCNHYYHYDNDDCNTITIDDRGNTETWCNECKENYAHRCDNCTDYFTDDGGIYNDNISLCYSCAENYTTCDNCGDYVNMDSSIYTDDEQTLCSDCYRENMRSNHIHDCGYKPEPNFLKSTNDNDIGTVRFFGTETEFDNGNDLKSCSDFLYTLSNREHYFYLKSDGSLDNGAEIVSHPMSLNYIQEKFRYMHIDIADTCKKYGFKSHDTITCGLHIHINRISLGDTMMIQDETIAKLLYVTEKYRNEFIKFSRRKNLRDNNVYYAQFYKNTNSILHYNADDIMNLLDDAKNSSRYHVWNLTNRYTIEFRLLQGTLNTDTHIAGIQFIDNFIELCKNTSMENIFTITFKDIIQYKEYKELNEYCIKKKLIDSNVDIEDVDNDTIDSIAM